MSKPAQTDSNPLRAAFEIQKNFYPQRDPLADPDANRQAKSTRINKGKEGKKVKKASPEVIDITADDSSDDDDVIVVDPKEEPRATSAADTAATDQPSQIQGAVATSSSTSFANGPDAATHNVDAAADAENGDSTDEESERKRQAYVNEYANGVDELDSSQCGSYGRRGRCENKRD